jgi:hypothetical protein
MNDNEFEKNRQEILRNVKLNKVKNPVNESKEKLWKYEILKYRNQRKKEKFFFVGAIAGILSLIINLVMNYEKIIELISKIIK